MILFTGGGETCVAGGCVAGRCACMAGSMCGREGACMAGGVWQGGVHGRRGACVAGEMTTAADGTHPTGMHSCFFVFFQGFVRIELWRASTHWDRIASVFGELTECNGLFTLPD